MTAWGSSPRGRVAAPGHLGLAAIRERAEMAGGGARSEPARRRDDPEVWLPDDAEAPAADEPNAAKDNLATVIPLRERIA